jgi:hypothetical protein
MNNYAYITEILPDPSGHSSPIYASALVDFRIAMDPSPFMPFIEGEPSYTYNLKINKHADNCSMKWDDEDNPLLLEFNYCSAYYNPHLLCIAHGTYNDASINKYSLIAFPYSYNSTPPPEITWKNFQLNLTDLFKYAQIPGGWSVGGTSLMPSNVESIEIQFPREPMEERVEFRDILLSYKKINSFAIIGGEDFELYSGSPIPCNLDTYNLSIDSPEPWTISGFYGPFKIQGPPSTFISIYPMQGPAGLANILITLDKNQPNSPGQYDISLGTDSGKHADITMYFSSNNHSDFEWFSNYTRHIGKFGGININIGDFYNCDPSFYWTLDTSCLNQLDPDVIIRPSSGNTGHFILTMDVSQNQYYYFGRVLSFLMMDSDDYKYQVINYQGGNTSLVPSHNRNSIFHSNYSGTETLQITSSAKDIFWKVRENSSWFDVSIFAEQIIGCYDGSAYYRGNGTITFSFDANPSNLERTDLFYIDYAIGSREIDLNNTEGNYFYGWDILPLELLQGTPPSWSNYQIPVTQSANFNLLDANNIGILTESGQQILV